MKNLSLQFLRASLDYDPETGVFIWKSGAHAGKVAGCIFSNGYRNIGFCGKMRGAHRLAWFYVHGLMPKQVDHINGDPADNRICNLRPSTQSENKQNARVKRTSLSGLKGVSWSNTHRKWRANIGPRGKIRHLGYFDSPEVAHAAYVNAAKEMYGEFARPN